MGQTKDKKHYAHWPQLNYATTEKELLAVVFVIDKFWSYQVGAKVIFYSDHAALKYILAKKDANPRLIRWVCLGYKSRLIFASAIVLRGDTLLKVTRAVVRHHS